MREPGPTRVSVILTLVLVGWIKMPRGTEIGRSPGDIVLDEDPSSHPNGKGHNTLTFRPKSIVAKRLNRSR